MYCCTNCLQDHHLQEFIITIGVTGRCDYCNTDNAKIVEVSKLRSKIEPFVEEYTPVENLNLYQDSDKNHSVGNITAQFNEDWRDIFNAPDSDKLLKDILGDDVELYHDLFEKKVLLKLKYDKRYRERNLQRKELWDNFKKEIKSHFRYFRVKSAEIEEFQNLLTVLSIVVPDGARLYRARISDEKGFNRDELGMPAPINATAGRANPDGIPYLYLSKEEATTIYEVRAGLHDYVTVGEFQVLEKVRIVNFRSVGEMSPLQINSTDLVDLIEYDSFIQNLMIDLAKPNRRFDSENDYIPTQYIIEMVKKRGGIDGVEYPSSMDSSGRNIVLFETDKVRCIGIKTFAIHDIKYDYQEI